MNAQCVYANKCDMFGFRHVRVQSTHTCMYLFRIEESHYRLVEWWMMDSENIHHEMCRFTFETNERTSERKKNQQNLWEKGTANVWIEWHLMSYEVASEFGNCIENDCFVFGLFKLGKSSMFSKQTKQTNQITSSIYIVFAWMNVIRTHTSMYINIETPSMPAKKLSTNEVNKQASNQQLLERYLVCAPLQCCTVKIVSSEMHYLWKALLCTHNVQDNVRPISRSLLVRSYALYTAFMLELWKAFNVS